MNKDDFQNLDAKEQAKIFHQSTLAEKSDLLLYSHEPERLVQSLSHEELFLVTREVDLEQRSEIIRFANLHQLMFVGDIDCWEKDRLHGQGFMKWLETLERAGPDKLLAWLVNADYETVVSGLNNIVTVLKPDWEYARDEALGDRPYFTIDDQYHIYVREENYATLKKAMELLFEYHRGRYSAVLEGILGEPDDILEEEAYQNRAKRLADRGFPETEIARQIYRPVTKKELTEFPKKNSPDEKQALHALHLPNYPALWKTNRLFLDECFTHLSGESQDFFEQLEEELAWLSNKVISSEGIDFSSEERVKDGIERARHMVSIGLEILSGCDPVKAKQYLKDCWLEMIFRFAVGRHQSLRESAREIARTYWGNSHPDFLDFLGEPYEMILRGALQEFARCYDPSVTQHPFQLRDFINLGEIERTEKSTAQIARMHAVLVEKFPKPFVKIRDSAKDSEDPPTILSLAAAVFAAFTVRGKIVLEPLTRADMVAFMEKGFRVSGKHRILEQSHKEAFLEAFHTSEDGKLLQPFWGVVFQEIEDELGTIKEAEKMDTRFLKCFWMKQEFLDNQRRPKKKSKSLKKRRVP